MCSIMREKPGPEVAVIVRAPAQAPPMIAAILAGSSSIWMKVPPTLGRRAAIRSATSVDGVIGYPAKKRHPAAIAPSAQAVFPLRNSILSVNIQSPLCVPRRVFPLPMRWPDPDRSSDTYHRAGDHTLSAGGSWCSAQDGQGQVLHNRGDPAVSPPGIFDTDIPGCKGCSLCSGVH